MICVLFVYVFHYNSKTKLPPVPVWDHLHQNPWGWSPGRGIFRSAPRVEDTALHLCCCVPFRKEDLWLCVWVLTTCASELWAGRCRLVKRRLEDPVCRWLTARMALWGWGRGCSPAVTGDPPRTPAFRDCLQPPSLTKWFLNLISSSLLKNSSCIFSLFLFACPIVEIFASSFVFSWPKLLF